MAKILCSKHAWGSGGGEWGGERWFPPLVKELELIHN